MSVYNQGFHVTVEMLRLTSDKAPVSPMRVQKKNKSCVDKNQGENQQASV